MCGEKPVYSIPGLIDHGSPPHVRGKAELEAEEWLQDRITPACAGKSC